jgi:phosphopantothenoylcysteine decarboxylase/phosphopantothenate--cysteine ligase
MTLTLSLTHDIAGTLGATKRADQQLIGFALETQNEKENALHKMERKHLNAIVLNSLRDEGAGFGCDTNIVTILREDGQTISLPLQSKAMIAEGIIDTILH